MKTKIIVLLAISCIATLSFAFKVGHKVNNKHLKQPAKEKLSSEPLGGFVSEDKL